MSQALAGQEDDGPELTKDPTPQEILAELQKEFREIRDLGKRSGVSIDYLTRKFKEWDDRCDELKFAHPEFKTRIDLMSGILFREVKDL